jgi:hypothetical protein
MMEEIRRGEGMGKIGDRNLIISDPGFEVLSKVNILADRMNLDKEQHGKLYMEMWIVERRVKEIVFENEQLKHELVIKNENFQNGYLLAKVEKIEKEIEDFKKGGVQCYPTGKSKK